MEHSYTEYWIQSSIITENSYWKMIKIWNGYFHNLEWVFLETIAEWNWFKMQLMYLK